MQKIKAYDPLESTKTCDDKRDDHIFSQSFAKQWQQKKTLLI